MASWDFELRAFDRSLRLIINKLMNRKLLKVCWPNWTSPVSTGDPWRHLADSVHRDPAALAPQNLASILQPSEAFEERFFTILDRFLCLVLLLLK